MLLTSATEGITNPKVRAYVDSILQFASAVGGEGANFLAQLSRNLEQYQTIEASILQEFSPTTTQLSLDVGLRLVRSSCDKLEAIVSSIDIENPLAALDNDEGLLLQH